MIHIDNNIYVFVKEHNKAILKYPKLYIETVAYIGKNGATSYKIEGDGKTPIGEFDLGLILVTNPNVKNIYGLKHKIITENMYWVDDSKSKYYNQLVDLSMVRKDWDSAEHLIDYPTQYEYLVEIKVNPNNIKGKGSAIFLHCSNGQKTEGCIAVHRDIMRKIIESMEENTRIIVTNK